MGICPRCGSWVDEGEPYCPECCYDGDDGNGISDTDSNKIVINGYEYDIEDVEDALDAMGHDLDDLKMGFVDEYELEEILDDM